MTGLRHSLVLPITLATLSAVVGCQARGSVADAGGGARLTGIAGGNFEASGVAAVPGTRTILFVDDGRPNTVYALELLSDGAQRSPARALALDAHVTDMEGMTHDGTHFYVVGSQSKRTGHDGDGLVRFRYDTALRRLVEVERVAGLKAWLAQNVAELRGTETRLGDHVLNIEAIAWDPATRRLLLGLRAPVIEGHALVVPLRLADSAGLFAIVNLRADSAIRLNLGGAGIRALEYDGPSGSFHVITGASLDRENRDFVLLEWDGRSATPTRELARHARSLKPEGITHAGSRRVLVFDTGRLLVLDSLP